MKTVLSIIAFILAAGMVITLLVFWNVYIISDYHTIRELYKATHGTMEVPAQGRWTVLILGIVFFSLVLVVLSIFFAAFLRGARFKRQQKDFVNMMTHELKLPMSSIQMFAQTLRQRDASPEDRARFLDAILNDCTRMNQLLDHLLKSQLIEKGRLPVNRRKVDLRAFMLDFVEKWPRPLEARIEADAEAQVDPVLLELALANLVGNAEKYGKGSIPVVGLEADGRRARISVKDEGQSIPRKYSRKIFRRFFRMPNRDTRRQSGVGLGLYIVRTIARLHGGRIELETPPQGEGIPAKGNRFVLSLPRLEARP